MECVLFYFPAGAADAAAARKTLVIHKLRVREVLPEQAGWTVERLAGLADADETETEETAPAEPALVFCGVPDRKLDETLAALRKAGVPRTVYRASMTDTNRTWSFAALCRELAGEREAIGREEKPAEK